MNRQKEIGLTLLVLLVLGGIIGSLAALSAAPCEDSDISGQLIRLHVIANSDTADDQALKLEIRDAILAAMTPVLGEVCEVAVARQLVYANLDRFGEIAGEVMEQKGLSYPVQVVIGRFPFPTRVYGDLVLPAGEYEALRVVIGRGQGQNWWCVLFPPLCFLDVTGGITGVPAAGEGQSPAEAAIPVFLSEQDLTEMPVELRFKTLELWHQSITGLVKWRSRLASGELADRFLP